MISQDTTVSDEQTDLLIVGAGPAGASLAVFLSEYGLKGILIAAAPGTAETPRAHITNMAALECLRDYGLEEECLAQATASENMEHTRWCYSMAGEEFARIHSWGHDPHRKGHYSDASPCDHVDLPQTLAEPILIKRALERGWDIRFNTAFQTFEDRGPGKGVISTVKDTKADRTYTIASTFLFGCDGGRSTIVRQLNLPLLKKPGQGLALNVLVDVDLSHLIKTRNGNLHWTIQPDRPHPKWGHMAIVRMVKPWHEWMFIILPDPASNWDPAKDPQPSDEEYMARVRDFIGDDSIPARLIGVSVWAINEIVAECYSSDSGNIHCLGDAVHRHPPFNGLGSNTCIQDAYNLAWKVAYTLRGKASPRLLDSYSVERQPVGLGVITRANQGLRDHLACWDALGVTEPTLEKSAAAFNELRAPTAEGARRRKAFQIAVAGTAREFHAVGQEMNQRYDGSTAVYFADESGPRPPLPEDAVLYHQISTYPGARLPHAWLNKRVPNQPMISTQDLVGKGRFVIISGPGDGDRTWHKAARDVSLALGGVAGSVWGATILDCVSVGYGCEWEDVYFDWAKRREVEDDGCVLVRPDRFVAWRSQNLPHGDVSAKVEAVIRTILGLVSTSG